MDQFHSTAPISAVGPNRKGILQATYDLCGVPQAGPRPGLPQRSHAHMDQLDYLGTIYYYRGDVCGALWPGSYYQFGPGSALLNLNLNLNLYLYDFGTSTRECVSYG
ncbi:hypothetical protein BH23PLA1_BH23PLA1_29600 [soil metagenome]